MMRLDPFHRKSQKISLCQNSVFLKGSTGHVFKLQKAISLGNIEQDSTRSLISQP